MYTETDLLDIVEQVHATALDTARWAPTLQTIADMFGAVDTTFEIIDKKTNRPLFMEMGGKLAFDIPDAYLEHYFKISPRVRHGITHPKWSISYDHAILSDDEIDADEFYMDLLAPRDLRYFIAGNVLNSDSHLGVIAVQRTAAQGHVGDEEIALMERLLPTVRQAIDTRFRLETAVSHNRLLFDGLDQLNEGVMLMDRRGIILHTNHETREILAEMDGIYTLRNQLRFSDGATETRYETLLQTLVSSGDGIPIVSDNNFIVRRPSGRRPYLVSLRSLPTSDIDQPGRESGAALIFIRDPDSYSQIDRTLLQDSYKLSPTEVALAVALDHGMTVQEVAEKRGVTIATMRGHLYALMGKMDVTRQADLTRLLRQYRLPF